MQPFSLVTDRLVLRPFEEGDVDDVLAYAHDKDFGRYVPTVPFPYEREHAEAFVTLAIEADWTREPYLAIVLDGRVIGAANLALDDARTTALGYGIGRAWWGQGLATEVAQAAISCAFSRYDVAVVWATADSRNVASHRVLQKAGMRLEGTLRQRRVHRGERHDECYFSILAEEWQVLQGGSRT